MRKHIFASYKTTTMKRAGAITRRPSRAHLRCTAAADGRFQGGHRKQTNAVECFF